MKKSKIIYSLTTRGLFSEILNLVLAIVYAKLYCKRIIVNTYNWNARIEKGWEDYFLPTIKCTNNFFSSQLRIFTQEKISLSNMHNSKRQFLRFYVNYLAYSFYKFFHLKTQLGDDVFFKMRNPEFVDNNDIIRLMSITIKDIYKYNERTASFLRTRKMELKIPSDYVGVHIRRGDKITMHEMEKIDLKTYIDKILEYKHISDNIYIATDDSSIIPYMRNTLSNLGFHVFFNANYIQKGFKESSFNTKNIKDRYDDMMNTLFDIDVLFNSKLFIGTYSSNMSRIIPLFIGFDRCISLDENWKII